MQCFCITNETAMSFFPNFSTNLEKEVDMPTVINKRIAGHMKDSKHFFKIIFKMYIIFIQKRSHLFPRELQRWGTGISNIPNIFLPDYDL